MKLDLVRGIIYIASGLPFVFIFAYITFNLINPYGSFLIAYLLYVFFFGFIWSCFIALFWSIFVGIPLYLIVKKLLMSKTKIIFSSAVMCFVISLVFPLTGLIEQRLIFPLLIISVLVGIIGGFGLVSPNNTFNKRQQAGWTAAAQPPVN